MKGDFEMPFGVAEVGYGEARRQILALPKAWRQNPM